MSKKIILTGAPCSGKTTLIDLLELNGFNTSAEVARQIIDKNKKNNSPILPGNGKINLYKFQHLVMYQQINQEANFQKGETYFLDRALIDIVGYSSEGEIPMPSMLPSEICNSNYSAVFFLELLPKELYQQDKERKEKYSNAQELQKHLYTAYKKTKLPIYFLSNNLTPQQRHDKVLENIL